MSEKTHSPYFAAAWSFIERFSSEIATFAISIILARLLSPSDYGIVGITTVFIAIFNVIIESGFSNALIRKLDRNEHDLATAFYFNAFVGIIAYSILFVTSSYIAEYFEEPVLSNLVKVVSLIVLINSFCIVPNAILTSQLNIKSQAYISIFSQIPAGIIAIFFAYHGLGLWALAIQQVFKSILTCILLWSKVHWFPKTKFSKQSFHYLWNFGSKLLLATLIGTIFNNIYSFLIGKYIGKNELGYYSKGQGLANHISTVSNGIVQKIGLPVLSKYQQDKILLQKKFRSIMCLIIMVIAPLSALCFFEAKDIIILLWTEKWKETIPMFQIIVCTLVMGPIGAMSLNLFQVVNRTDITLKLEFFKKAVFAIVIFISFQYGIYALLLGMLFNNTFAALVNMYPTKYILNYSYISQLVDLFKYIIYSYSIGYALSLIINFDCRLINILLYSIAYISTYTFILYLLKDKYFIKYSVVIYNKLRNRL